MRANIVRKQRNNFGCDTVSCDKACETSEKKARLWANFSTSKPEIYIYFFKKS